MKQLSISILFLVFVLPVIVRAHTGVGATQNYGNISVHSYKDLEVEEFRKAFIIGQLAKKLADQMQCTDSIHLDFLFNYYKHDSLPTAYHVSVEQIDRWGKKSKTGIEKIVIRQYAYQYDFEATLKLLEYAIKNRKQIKKSQTWKRNPAAQGVRSFLSISDDEIGRVQRRVSSAVVKKVMQTRVDRPLISSEDRQHGVSYYWQNGAFHIFKKMRLLGENKETDAVITELPDIYNFHSLFPMTVVFDSPASFYFIGPGLRNLTTGVYRPSSRQTILAASDIDWGTKVSAISPNDISIYFRYGLRSQSVERMLLYFSGPDTLIQDGYNLGNRQLDSVSQPRSFEEIKNAVWKPIVGNFTTWRKQLDFLKQGGRESSMGRQQLRLVSYAEVVADEGVTIDAFKAEALAQTVAGIRNRIPIRKSKNDDKEIRENLKVLRDYKGPKNDLKIVKLNWLLDASPFHTYAVVSAFHDSVIYDDIISYVYTQRLSMLRYGLRYSEWEQ
jgi:hypothetical protein